MCPRCPVRPRCPVQRLVTALLVEISEQWETGKIYLNMKSMDQPQT